LYAQYAREGIELASPSINLSGDDIPASGDLADRRARRKRLRDDRL
jgi:hypothetical protein